MSLLSNDETDRSPMVDECCDWCNHLDINVSKTKEMIPDVLKKLFFMARLSKMVIGSSVWGK